MGRRPYDYIVDDFVTEVYGPTIIYKPNTSFTEITKRAFREVHDGSCNMLLNTCTSSLTCSITSVVL